MRRMTANPVKPARHRAGRPTGVESSSELDSDVEEQQQQEEEEKKSEKVTAATKKKAPAAPHKIPQPPKLTGPGRIISKGATGKIDLRGVQAEKEREAKEKEEIRRRQEAAARAAEAERLAKEQGFVTDEGEDEDEDEGSEEEESGEEDDEDEEESSEEEAPKRVMVRPKFIPKSQRVKVGATAGGAESNAKTAEEEAEAEEARRRAADELVEEQIRKALAAKAQGRKAWEDDDEAGGEGEVDDTDDIDPEAEYAAWSVSLRSNNPGRLMAYLGLTEFLQETSRTQTHPPRARSHRG